MTQPLDWIARSDEAVFAMDMADRIVVWNGHCERLLGRPAASVLGRRCADVMCGRDVHGNVYCVQNCPVALQARELPDEPVNAFRLSVPMPNQAHRWVRVSVFHIASPRPGLSTLVHVLNDPEAPLSLLEVRLAEEARRESERKYREQSGVFFVEGIRIVSEAVQVGAPIEELVVAPDPATVLRKLERQRKRPYA